VSTAAELNTPLDFSNAYKLKEVVFRVETLSAVWMTLALETITSAHRNFHHISIHITEHIPSIANYASPRETFGETFYGQLMNLDRLLVQFWESRGIRPKVGYNVSRRGKGVMFEYIGCLFPEITKRGIAELVDLSVSGSSRKSFTKHALDQLIRLFPKSTMIYCARPVGGGKYK